MLGNTLTSQFVLINSVTATDGQASNFGQNIEWVGTDLFAVTSDLTTPWVGNDIGFSDDAYFDGGGTQFGQLYTSFSQKVDIFQVLETNRKWINSTQDILNPVPVKTIPITGNQTSEVVYSGAIDNFFVADSGNPNEAIKIFNNQNLSHGWAVFTAQQQRIDSGSISRSWIYDSITRIKLADLEVVDLYAGILPGAIASQLDFICDIDPAIYNIPIWIPGNIYSIGDRVLYGGQTYQALYAGKSGTIFNAALWSLIPTISNTNAEGNIKWGSSQLGRTWFKTAKLKVVNAQLGTLTQRAQNWNTWFPNAAIEVYEWVNSSVPPATYISNSENGFILDQNCPFTYDAATGQYGFWVLGKDSLGPIHTQTAAQLIGDIIDIPGSGIPMITAIDTNAVAVWNINQFVSANTVVLHIDYVNESANNQLHNEFALISNDGSKSWFRTPIYPKFVDSLSGVSETNQLVPDYTLPIQQQAGILNNPVQSLFVNRATALDIYFSVINSQIANLAIASAATITALSAYDPPPTSGFNEQIPDRSVLNELDPSLYPENYRILLTEDDTLNPIQWSIVANVDSAWQIAQHQLYNLVNNWEYADWFASNYTPQTPTYVLNNAGELTQITYITGDIIKILNDGNGNETIYLAVQNTIDPNVTELDPIYIQNGTIQFLPNLYDFLTSGIGFDNQGFDSQGFDNDPYLAIRLITEVLNNIIFVGSDTLTAAADDGFFSILKYIFYENENLDWLFKTSFVTVDYDNRNLNVQGTFQPDNQASIEDFVSETLPFHTRVREFRDTYSANDYGNIGAVDFDLPSQYDSNYANIVYNFTPNPKLNTLLPLSAFEGVVGVSSDSRASYITSSGIPANPTMPSIPQDWQFGFVTTPITQSIKYDTVPDTVGPIAVAIDGVPFFSPNSGTTETLYLYGTDENPFANIGVQATYTLNSVWTAQQESLDPGAGFTNENGAYQYLTNPYVMSNVSIGSTIKTFPVGNSPAGIAIDLTGNIWTTNQGDNTISKLSSIGAPLGTFPVGNNPTGIAIDSTGNVWVTNQADNTVSKRSSIGATLGTFTVGNSPSGIAIDSTGNAWVANNGNHTVSKLSSIGATLGTFTVGYVAQQIAIDQEGNVWVTNQGDNTVSKLSSIGALLGTFPVGNSPDGIAIDSFGNAWIANVNDNTVTKLNSIGATLGTFPVGNSPYGIAIDQYGNIWVTNGDDNTVSKLNSIGVLLQTFPTGYAPNYIVIDTNNNAWITNLFNNTVSEIIFLPSPIIGYAWDGNPIYGPYGYTNANGTGIFTNTSSYQLSTIPRLDKTGQPIINGLQMAVYASPTGEYIEDFIYVPNSGTLDECNGRYVVTPEYPTGVYAYFATVSPSNVSIPTYPYIIGPCYNSRPFGLKYVYIDGVNTPIYLNGNVTIPLTPVIDTVNLVRTPDGSIPSDQLTLQEPVYSAWSNNHTYSIGSINVERPGEGYLDLSGNVIIYPTNNAAANIASLQVVSAILVTSGNNYSNGEIVTFIGGAFSNAAAIQVSNVNPSANNCIVSFSLYPITFQGYTELPADINNVGTSSSGNGSGASFAIDFGLESIFVSENGNNFSYTPSITVTDANATTAATLYPELDNSLTRKINTSLIFDRIGNTSYSGVFVNAGEFSGSYTVPNGTIFDSNDSTAGQISLNISWRPELISDTALSTEYSRFGNSGGVFNNEINQYIIAKPSSPDLDLLAINANSFTLEFFMNFSNMAENIGVMVDTRENISSANGIVVFRDGGNLCVGSNTNVSIISTGIIPFTTNNWDYITVQGCAGNIFAYMNGELIGTANTAYNFSDANLTLGADVNGGNVSTGYMDEIRLTVQHNRYTPGIININVPTQAFPRTLAADPYLLPTYTPLLWGFENFINESETNITFTSVNAQTLISDLSWNQKKLQLVNYGANLVIDTSTINTIYTPQTSEILAVILNQG